MGKRIADYLGGAFSELVKDAPFKDWSFKRSVERDLDEPRAYYVFQGQGRGISVHSDLSETIQTVFVQSAGIKGFDYSLLDASFSWSRSQVRANLGEPEKSGEERVHAILGRHGAWDRFELSQYVLHMEYQVGAESIAMVTLMKKGSAP